MTDQSSDVAGALPAPVLVDAGDVEPTLEQLIREAYAAHFIMWNLGITETVTAVRPLLNAPLPGEHYALVACRARGREFVYHIAPLVTEAERTAFLEAWAGFASRQPRMSLAERDAMVLGTITLSVRPRLEHALRQKGLSVL